MAADHDLTTERHEGPTPNGGVRSLVYYRDAAGNPTPKGGAAAAEVIEFDADGREVHRTYADIRPHPTDTGHAP